jgi:transcriptional regulator with PAS, ATPase and Fis domain
MLETILNNLRTGVVYCDPEAKIRYLNRSYAELYRIDRENAIGCRISEFFPGKTRVEHVIETGEPDIDTYYQWNGFTQIISRYPVLTRDRVIGALAEVHYRRLEEIEVALSRIRSLRGADETTKGDNPRAFAPHYTFDCIIGESEVMKNAREAARRFAMSKQPVLLYGETGTGKELFAHAIHGASPWVNGPLVVVNCSAITDNLFESEFFGYERGAFTGASLKGKQGKLEVAHGGTLFLDEIGDLPLGMQAKLLRVLDGHSFERVGGNKPIRVNFRLICATNRDLEKMVRKNMFRNDLLQRINTFNLTVPPLRERRMDIKPLCEYYINMLRVDSKAQVELSEEVLEIFGSYEWSGNVRQLKSVICFALTYMNGHSPFVILPKHLPGFLSKDKETLRAGDITFNSSPLSEALADFEKQYIQECLSHTGWNKQKASRILSVSRQTLYEKMKRYRISRSN